MTRTADFAPIGSEGDARDGGASVRNLRYDCARKRGDILDNTQAFDPAWYRATYQDVALAGLDPKYHYLNYGCMLNRGISAAEPTGAGLGRLVTALSRPRDISYCIPVMNRPDDIRSTLAINLRENAAWRETVEFIVMFFDADRDTQDWVRERFAEDIADGHLRLVVSDRLDGWHFGKAKNAFKAVATGAVYSSLDADNFVTAEETRQLLEVRAAHGDAFVFHHFTGEWGDGSSGRVSLPTPLFRAVGYDDGLLPRQYDEVDLILSTLVRYPRARMVRYDVGTDVLTTGRTAAFAVEASITNPVVVTERARQLRPLNPKRFDYAAADPVLQAMHGFNQAVSHAKNAPRELRAKHLDLAVKCRRQLVDAADSGSLLDMLFETRGPRAVPRVAPGEICLFACIKDDDVYLPAFHAHYAALGVAHFFLVDDRSATPVGARLAQEDVHVFRPKVGQFASAKCLWLEALLKAFVAPEAWFLTVDADEFLDVPPPYSGLREVTAALEARQARFAPGLLIDMLPGPALSETAPEALETRFQEIFDEHLALETSPSADYAAHRSIQWGFGPYARLSWSFDARYHGFGTFDSLRKLPLARYRPKLHIHQGFHTLYDENAAPLRSEIWETDLVLPIRHYKLVKLFMAEGRRDAMAKIAGPAGSAYHARTTDNIGRIFGSDAADTVAKLRALPRQRKARPAPVIDPRSFR